jgi:hypothetical protein
MKSSKPLFDPARYPSKPDPLVTPGRAAELLCIPFGVIERAIRSGSIPSEPVGIGNLRSVRLSHAIAYFERNPHLTPAADDDGA